VFAEKWKGEILSAGDCGWCSIPSVDGMHIANNGIELEKKSGRDAAALFAFTRSLYEKLLTAS